MAICCENYEQYVATMRDRPPDGARDLFELDLHDSELIGVHRPFDDHVVLAFDGSLLRGEVGRHSRHSVWLVGVRSARVPDHLVGDLALASEVILCTGGGTGFDFNVLFVNGELSITAEEAIVQAATDEG